MRDWIKNLYFTYSLILDLNSDIIIIVGLMTVMKILGVY